LKGIISFHRKVILIVENVIKKAAK